MRKEGNLYEADEGKILQHKTIKNIRYKSMILGASDNIDNYEEIADDFNKNIPVAEAKPKKTKEAKEETTKVKSKLIGEKA
jgi:hypothetical protein